jgi:adenosylcobinamide-phosphate synthase
MDVWPDSLLVVVAALAWDAVLGDPDWLWRRAPHPVVLIGQLIDGLDTWLNREQWTQTQRRIAGVVTVVLLVTAATIAGLAIEHVLSRLPAGPLWIALVASILIAQRSLYQHVARVAAAFDNGGLVDARRAVAMIVGRDTQQLDEGGVCRAAIESCAENFSDGVVAPVFWLALLGLPGLVAYKAINTADSMIGHRSARHEAFGWAAARLDDLVNLAPARLAGLLLALVAPIAGGNIGSAIRTMRRDARLHRSPNAGWPESAMAGALGLALAGPRRYASHIVDDPFLNPDGRRDAKPTDIRRALCLLIAACVLQAVIYGLIALMA